MILKNKIKNKKIGLILGTIAVILSIATVFICSVSEVGAPSTPDEATIQLATIVTTSIETTVEPTTELTTEKPTEPTTEFVEERAEEIYEETYEESYVETEIEEEVYSYNAAYSPSDLQFQGVIYWNGWRWTWYSERILPGGGLNIPGRHTESNTGFVCDGDGYICLASSSLSKGTVVETPFGRMGKVYDCGCASDVLDVYVNW